MTLNNFVSHSVIVLVCVVFSTMVESYSSGCNNGINDVVFVSNKIVGCKGSFVGGLFGTQAKNLCNSANGWHICRNENEVKKLGLTAKLCQSKSPPKTFWATQQKSTGYAICNNRGSNDVFGCANSPNAVKRSFATQCSVLKYAVQCNANAKPFTRNQLWRCSRAFGYNELNKMNKYTMNGGGVMCCRDIKRTKTPTNYPTNKPTNHPTNKPTNHPTNKPTNRPTNRPLSYPKALYRYYLGKPHYDHFYTMNYNELMNGKNGYVKEGIQCYIFPRALPGKNLVALYRLYHPGVFDHIYTTSYNERLHIAQHGGYKYEGIAGYVSAHKLKGTVPLYRLYNGRLFDHFYTTNAHERSVAISRLGYVNENIIGYVWPNAATGIARRLQFID